MILATPGLTPRISAPDHIRCNPSLTEVVVVCACDDRYAMPLNVMLHSAATTLDPGSRLTVYFLDGGLSQSSWDCLGRTLQDLPIDVLSVQPDYSLVEHLHTSHHVTPAAYLRLLTAELMPETVGRVIYLDSDLLVCEDLTGLWNLPLDHHYCLAAADIACPWIDARVGCANRKKAIPYLAALNPVPNWQRLGLDPSAPYFNSGVMVLNLHRWREDQVAVRMLECLETHRKHVWCWDQYALNVMFHGQWGRLPARWNQGAHSLEFPTVEHSPIDPGEFSEMLENPAIVHFTTEFKPWHFHWQHLRGEEFFTALDRTSFRGWRPERPPFSWRRWQQRQGMYLAKWLVTNYRRITAVWGGPAA